MSLALDEISAAVARHGRVARVVVAATEGSAPREAGAAMLVLPGPGWVVIFGGMAIWATEFVWAQLVLRWTKRKVTEAAQRALDPKVRRRNIILTSIGVVIIAALAGIYLWKFGLEMPWNIKDQ